MKPSRRVLAFYCSAGDGGSQQAAWWEASIKVSGRLIVIQSGGRLRYQFPVRPRSFPLRVSSLRFFFSLSLFLSLSSFLLFRAGVSIPSIASPFLRNFRDLSSLWIVSRRRRRRRRRKRRRRSKRRRSVLEELCVPLRVHYEYKDCSRGVLWWRKRWLAGWGTHEIDSVVATTFHTDPVYLASRYEAGVGTRLGNRPISIVFPRGKKRLLARKFGERVVESFRGGRR